MKSNSSNNTKNATKRTQKVSAKPAKELRNAPKSEAGPFQGLDNQSAVLLPALILAVEKYLELKGLEPSISRRPLLEGLAYYFSVNHAVSIEIGIAKPKTGTYLRFWINGVFGHVLRDAKRVHLLETLLELNAEAAFPIYLGLTRGSHIQAHYTARVHDQLTIGSVGDTIDRVVGYAMWVREKLNQQSGFAPLSFKGDPGGSEAAREHSSEEKPGDNGTPGEPQVNELPGPNGWVH